MCIRDSSHPMVCGRETIDRRDLDLPGSQDQLMRAVRGVNPRTVLVLTSSYPYAIGWAKEQLPAVLWSAHGGQEHGAALADVLLGAEPSGRLTQTWYRDDSELPDLLDYDIIATDATYLYYRGTPLFPFGHGLSYTRFRYDDLRLNPGPSPSPPTTSVSSAAPGGGVLAVDPSGTVTVSVDVTNTGDRPGDEVVQLYTRQQHSRVKQPLRRLRGHQRIRLAPGERARVSFELDVADLAFWDVTRSRWVVEQATHTIAVGGSSLDWARTATLRVRGEVIPPRTARSGLRLIDHDAYAGTTPVAIAAEPGEALRSAAPDAWVLFADVDLNGGLQQISALGSTDSTSPDSSGPAGFPASSQFFVSSLAPDSSGSAGFARDPGEPGGTGGAGTVTVRLDDPFTGPVLATLAIPPAGGRLDTVPVRAPIGPVSGVHDVYVLFERPGITMANLAFF